jgi:hypothetical protein
MNDELHIIGVTEEDMYLWRMVDDEKPVKVYNEIKKYGDILIVDTKMEKDYPTYTLIGNHSMDSISNSNIMELKEVSLLNYGVFNLFDKKGILGKKYIKKIDNYSMDCCQITKSKILGALFRDALFLYDFNKGENLFVIEKKGQQVLEFKMVEAENVIYVLTYHLYFEHLDNGMGLVRCYMIQDGKLIEEKEWFPGKYDMKKAVMAKNGESLSIYFNQYNNNTIYQTDYESKNYEEFYKLPKSMYLEDLVTG